MSNVFPLDQPGPTALYLTLYVVTFAVHAVLSGYVLAGSGYLAMCLARRAVRDPVFVVVRDWLPFALGAAITAGVAPLLFLQILYERSFYTANLLLFHRWMLLLPALIIGFYLLYLIKSATLERLGAAVRGLAGLATFVCFAFTAWTFTENHLLSLRPERWPPFFEHGDLFYSDVRVLVRFAAWVFCGTWIFAGIAALQLSASRGKDAIDGSTWRRLGWLAVAGVGLFGGTTLAYLRLMDGSELDRIAGGPAILVLSGGLLLAASWTPSLVRGRPPRLAATVLGGIGTILGLTLVREALRAEALDIAALYDQHAAAAEVGGLTAFVAFALINGVLVGWAIRLAASLPGNRINPR